MFDKYLTSFSAARFEESADVSLRYKFMKDIMGVDTSNIYEDVVESAAIKRLLTRKNTLLGDTKNPDTFYTGTVWCFAEAVERGLDKRTTFIANTASYIADRFQTKTGGFSFDWRPPTPVACRTGDMVRFFLTAGINDETVKNGINWILQNQRHDGGWLHCPLEGICDTIKLTLFKKAGGGLSREKDSSVTSCFYATLSCARALVLAKETNSHILKRAIDFFLGRKLFRNRNGLPVLPKRGWNKDFRLLGYPLLCQYDILSGLQLTAEAGYINDSKTGEAFNIFMEKQNSAGLWQYESFAPGMLFQKYNGEQDLWLTLRALYLFKKMEDETTQ